MRLLSILKVNWEKYQGVITERNHKGYIELVLDENTTPQQVLERLVDRGLTISRFEIATPSLNEIFLEMAGKSHE